MSICPIMGDAIITAPTPSVITDSDRNHQWMLKVLVTDLARTGVHLLSDYLLISKRKRYLSNGKIWQIPDFSDLSSCG